MYSVFVSYFNKVIAVTEHCSFVCTFEAHVCLKLHFTVSNGGKNKYFPLYITFN